MKKIIITASGLLFAASLYVGVNAYTNSNLANDLLLSNVEAMTRGENWFGTCSRDYTPSEAGGYIVVCNDGYHCSTIRAFDNSFNMGICI